MELNQVDTQFDLYAIGTSPDGEDVRVHDDDWEDYWEFAPSEKFRLFEKLDYLMQRVHYGEITIKVCAVLG